MMFSFAGYSGLEGATPDDRRLPDTPCSNTGTAYDRFHHPSSRSSYRKTLSLLRNLCRYDTTRPPCARRPRSQSTILKGNVPSRSDYCTVARSGFTASAAPAPPTKAQLRSSPPPRLTRLGCTIPLDPHASPGSSCLAPPDAAAQPAVGLLAAHSDPCTANHCPG